jgi:integrase
MYFARAKGDLPAIRTTPKNEYSVRRIALSDRAKEILEKFQQASYCLRMWQKANVTTYAEDGYIFINKVGNVYDRSFVNRVLRKIEYHKPISTHIFRHTHISLLAEENVPIKAIMARVGHNDPSTTLEIYTHATNDMKNQATEAINRIGKRINA